MFNADSPIKYIHEDLLNRKGFAKSISEAILKSQTKDSIVISLLGKWGSGKTSLVNMVVEHIEDISKPFESEKKPIIVYFNPWNFSEQDQLINQFFNQLSSSLERIDYSPNLKQASKLLKNYAKIIKPFTYIPSIGSTASFLTDLLNVTSDVAESSGEVLEKDLNGIKNDLFKLLGKKIAK